MGGHAERASMIYQALAYEVLSKAMKQYRETTDKKVADYEEEIAGLKESLARFVDATPPAGGPHTPEAPPPVDEKDDLADRMAKRFEKESRPTR